MYNLLQSSSAAVRYEAAGTLLTLSNAPTAIRAAAHAYIDLVVKESDNNVKVWWGVNMTLFHCLFFHANGNERFSVIKHLYYLILLPFAVDRAGPSGHTPQYISR